MYFKKKVNGYRTLLGDTQDWTLSDSENRTLLRVGKMLYASEFNYDTLEKMLLNEKILDLDALGFEPVQQTSAAQNISFDIAQTLEQAGNAITKAIESIIRGNHMQPSVSVEEKPIVDGGVDGLGAYTHPSENLFIPQLGGDEIS